MAVWARLPPAAAADAAASQPCTAAAAKLPVPGQRRTGPLLLTLLVAAAAAAIHVLGHQTAAPPPATVEICEDLGHVLPWHLHAALSRPFRRDEAEAARRALGLHNASTRLASPVAIWLVGPSATGKSTVARRAALDMGMAELPTGPAAAEASPPSAPSADEWALGMDGVLIDGEAFRATHRGYRAVVADGMARGCVWRQAYPALREALRREKAKVLWEAVRRRANLIIPDSCQNKADCWGILEKLKARGYVNHVVLVLGRRDIIRRRGEARAGASGKRHAPHEWDTSVENAFGLALRADGYSELIWTTNWVRRFFKAVRRGRGPDVLASAARLDASFLPAARDAIAAATQRTGDGQTLRGAAFALRGTPF